MNEKKPLNSKGYAAAKVALAALAAAWDGLPSGGRVWLAVSGGLDSMVLLEGVARLPLAAAERARVAVLHVNHGLRGAESLADQAFVRERALALGFPLVEERVDWRDERPSQERARKRREAIYARLASFAEDRVWLAHHLNDQAETVFFRLLRGTGIDGLAGMRPGSGKKMRPFLGLEKAVLERAARHWGIAWREDSSNLQPKYERNWLRLELLPLLEGRRPGFQARLAALAEEAAGLSAARQENLVCWEWQPGVLLARPIKGCAARELKDAFSLGRRHAEALAALLASSSGRLEAEGVRFAWSKGILLAEKGKARLELQLEEQGAGRFSGSFGRWDLPSAEFAPFEAKPLSGEAVKKEFQKLGVPRFFRPGIPVLARRGRPLVLLPAPPLDGLRFEPSPLASWWLAERRG